MSNIYATMKSCLYKGPGSEQVEVITNADDIKESDAPEYSSNKKTDEVSEPGKQPSLLWRMSSGVYSTASGAVGYGYGGVKWVAGKTYDVGSTVVSKVPRPPIPFVKKKDKNE
ncbi:transmembrane protein 263-like [Haliotis cracherodii]|uniref:transmembrane protein 263-like n=1 Tax=Haliotis rufescens TaxID=6454 RepID=UPI001EAF9D97|nr:transmembrane protein 263-like [Haliotis rufescens]